MLLDFERDPMLKRILLNIRSRFVHWLEIDDKVLGPVSRAWAEELSELYFQFHDVENRQKIEPILEVWREDLRVEEETFLVNGIEPCPFSAREIVFVSSDRRSLYHYDISTGTQTLLYSGSNIREPDCIKDGDTYYVVFEDNSTIILLYGTDLSSLSQETVASGEKAKCDIDPKKDVYIYYLTGNSLKLKVFSGGALSDEYQVFSSVNGYDIFIDEIGEHYIFYQENNALKLKSGHPLFNWFTDEKVIDESFSGTSISVARDEWLRFYILLEGMKLYESEDLVNFSSETLEYGGDFPHITVHEEIRTVFWSSSSKVYYNAPIEKPCLRIKAWERDGQIDSLHIYDSSENLVYYSVAENTDEEEFLFSQDEGFDPDEMYYIVLHLKDERSYQLKYPDEADLCLDFIGMLFNLPRYEGESDKHYRDRLREAFVNYIGGGTKPAIRQAIYITMGFRPKIIEPGPEVAIWDESKWNEAHFGGGPWNYATFIVVIPWLLWINNFTDEDKKRLYDLLQRVKASGVQAVIMFTQGVPFTKIRVYVDKIEFYLNGSLTHTESGAMITDSGLNLLLRLLCGDTEKYVDYCAVGSGTTPPSASDTQLENEIDRVPTHSYDIQGNRLELEFLFDTTEGNGTINEVGLLNEDEDGILFARQVLSTPISKTNTDTLLIRWTIYAER